MIAASDDAVVADLQRMGVTARRLAAVGEGVFFDPDDELYRLAARMLIINVSTAADRLSPELRDRHPDVPWSSIRATRNYIAHADDQVNDRIVWFAVSRDVPALIDRLRDSVG